MKQNLEETLNSAHYTQRMQLLFIALLFAIALIFSHYAGMNYYLYWVYWWFDMLVHTLGGIAIGLVSLLVLQRKQHIYVPGIAISIIAAWELFEVFIVRIPIVNVLQYGTDTAIDVITGALGFFLAFVIYNRTITTT